MLQDLGSAAGRVLLALLPLVLLAAIGFELGWVRDTVFAGLAAAVVLIAITHFLTLRLLRAEARDAVGALGPEAAVPAAPRRRMSPGAWAIWPAALRLDRAWQEHAAQLQTRLSAAEAILAAVPDPLFLLDDRRRVIRANAAALALVGALPEPRDLAAALRDPAVLEAADAVLAGEMARVVDFAVSVPVERQLSARIARIVGPALDGAVAVMTLHDITALKRSEAMRADFVANASHELRTPLATLIGFVETLRGAARDDAEARDRFLAIMHEQASRMARLVADLLSLSQIELNEHVPPQEQVALPPLLRQVAAALELRAAQRRMRIAVSLPADLPLVRGDADELAQVFQNLLDNAIKYGREGTEITVAAEPSRQLPGQGDFVAVTVADQGDGIAPEHLARLTERFYRVDNARSRALGGTGLGLAIVKHILNRHRGFLEIDSTPGRGSAFTVNLHRLPEDGPPRPS